MSDRMQQQTDSFRQALQAIQSVEDFTFGEPVLRDRRMLSAGLFISNALYTRDRQSELGSAPYNEFEFEPDSARLLGTTDSQHGVIFGGLHTYVDTTRVAVKCFEKNYSALALREYVAYEFMQRKGFEGFTPLGIVAHQDNTFLLTEDEPSLQTFNNMLWTPAALRINRYGDDQIGLLNKAGNELGKIHAMRITHGDARPKNVAVSERGRVGFIDFESLIFDPNSKDREAMVLRQADDLLSFYGVLRQWHGYNNGMDKHDRYDIFNEHFMNHYEETYRKCSTTYDEKVVSGIITTLRVGLMKYMLVEKDMLEKDKLQ